MKENNCLKSCTQKICQIKIFLTKQRINKFLQSMDTAKILLEVVLKEE